MARKKDNTIMLRFKEEKICKDNGFSFVAGVDEVGRGCLAGPVVASAVIMSCDKRSAWFRKVRDSKLLSSEQREYLFPLIHEAAVSIGTGVVYPDMIDAYGMTKAVQLAMKKALIALSPRPEFVLIDYFSIPDLDLPNKGVEDGDTLCFSIACASVVAKVFRDRLMTALDARFPGYGLARHKGYGTEEHVSNLRKLGPSPIHRSSFRPVKEAYQLSLSDFESLEACRD
jgi:ribonuclease HII